MAILNQMMGAFKPSGGGSPGLIWHLRAEGLGLADGDPISSATDLSGAGFHATGSGSTRPIYKPGIVGGKAVMRFTAASNTRLATAVRSPYGALSIFLVLKNAALSGQYALTLGNDNNAIICEFTAGAWEWFDTPRTQIGNTSTSVFQIIKTNVASGLAAAWLLGSASGGAGPYFNGDIAEARAYDSSLSTGDMNTIGTELQTYYGL
jgi:hypothetical protein